MEGAREYATLFESGQYGGLYIESGHHARGYTLQIYVLPLESTDKPILSLAVKVYGIIGGQPGWSERYGWLHQGPWQEDFYNLVAGRKLQLKQKKEQDLLLAKKSADDREAYEKEVLRSYVRQTSGN